MVRLLDRRSFLAAGATAGVVTIAGCGQDSGATETENTEAGTDEPDTTDGNNGSTGSASFDLDVTVDQLPDAFESLGVEFTGFEFFDVDESTVTRESDPVQFDLVELASGGASMDPVETTVPAGEYDSITYFITATDTTMSSGDGEQTFLNDEDGEVLVFLAGPQGGSFDIEAAESITLTPGLVVRESFENDWRFGTRFDTLSDVDRQS